VRTPTYELEDPFAGEFTAENPNTDMSTRRKEQLLGQLRSADADARAEAADQVREHVIPSIRKTIIDQLVCHLDSRYYDKRWQAVRALGLIGSARSDILTKLTSRLGDKHEYVRRCAAVALGRISSDHERVAECDGVIDGLNDCLDDDCEKVRREAKQALQAIADQNASESSNSECEHTEVREEEIYEGEVKTILDYGALVEIVAGHVGLLHVSQMDFSYVEDATDYCQVGDRLRVKVLEVSEDGKCRLTHKPFIEPNPWDKISDTYDVGETVRGEVARVQGFGALVNLDIGVTGLVPVSELKVDCPDEVASVGQRVETQILEISPEDERMILTPKRGGTKNQTDQKRAARDSSHSNGMHSGHRQSERELLLVDGSNVCRSWPAFRRGVSLNVLLTFLLVLVDQGFDFECIFDANIPYVLRNEAESGAESAYQRLGNDMPLRFSEVPGGTDADDQLLQKADVHGHRIVTNDRFRKREDKEKREKYPWITGSNPQRLIRGNVNGRDLQVVRLNICAEMRTDTQRMLDELLWAIKGVDGYDSQECGARFRGKLKFFDAKKGFGFINPFGFDEDVYFHASNLSDAAVGEDLREGQRVEFGVEHGDKGPKALDASPLG